MKIVNHSVQLLDSNIYPTSIVESVAKTCYQSEMTDTKDKQLDFIRKLIKNGHTAMIEFANISFRIITDRGVSHELVRHKHICVA